MAFVCPPGGRKEADAIQGLTRFARCAPGNIRQPFGPAIAIVLEDFLSYEQMAFMISPFNMPYNFVFVRHSPYRHNRFAVDAIRGLRPKVVAARQPWAEGLNAVGV